MENQLRRVDCHGDGLTHQQAYALGCANLARGGLIVFDVRLQAIVIPMSYDAAEAMRRAVTR